MSDLNIKIGKGKCGNLVCEDSPGFKNESGDKMNLFIEEEELIIQNTFFKMPL